jgi:hypothetical protein
VGVIGGGQRPLPGEVSLARHDLELLRQPLEKRITRVQPPGRPGSRCFGRDRCVGRDIDGLARNTVARYADVLSQDSPGIYNSS